MDREKRGQLLSIGEMAEANRVSIATLRLYDRMGLLQPCCRDEESNYRYYDIRQTSRLDIIRYMRNLNMSLAEIQTLLEKEDIMLIEQKLIEKNNQIHQQMRDLKAMHEAVERTIQSIERYRKSPASGTTSLEFIDQRHILYISCTENFYEQGIVAYEKAVHALRRELMEAYIDEHGVDPKPGMHELLSELRRRGLRIGLATATDEPRARKYLRIVGAEDYFDAVTCASMVAPHGKPEPDIYLLAAQRTGVLPAEAMAVEDAPSGVRSAHAAGLFTVMVPDQDQPDAALRALCDAVVPSLFDVAPLLDTARP